MDNILLISPGAEVVFDSLEVSESFIYLKNISLRKVAFKIKTTHP